MQEHPHGAFRRAVQSQAESVTPRMRAVAARPCAGAITLSCQAVAEARGQLAFSPVIECLEETCRQHEPPSAPEVDRNGLVPLQNRIEARHVLREDAKTRSIARPEMPSMAMTHDEHTVPRGRESAPLHEVLFIDALPLEPRWQPSMMPSYRNREGPR
jgi:hypothetical protein